MNAWQLSKNRKYLFAYRSVFIPFCLFFLFIAVDANAYAERTVERDNQQAISRIKTAYIYNFLKYIELQNNMPEKTETFRVCVYGKNPFGEALHNMNGRQAKGILVKVVKIEEVEQARSCHIVYISESESNNIAALLSAIRAQAILTVSDINNLSLIHI